MNHYKIDLGHPGYFKEECLALFKLLNDCSDSTFEITLDNKLNPWILSQPIPFEITSNGKPGDITLYTSGTTGIPKPITKNLMSEKKTSRGMGKSEDIWLLTYSPSRWAGLSVYLHCVKNKSKLEIPSDLSIESICKHLDLVTHISMTPSLFKKMILSGLISPKSNISQVTFGGEYATQKTLDEARYFFPQARISHIYATTELGDVCGSSDGLEGYKSLPGDIDENGELVINGIKTGDIWEKTNNRYYFKSRLSEMISVGGAKVFPIQIEDIIKNLAGIQDVKVYGLHSSLLGQIVCADIVTKRTSLDLTKELRLLLPKYAIPKINIVEEIELTKAGKKSRI